MTAMIDPNEYMKNAKGALIPISKVKEIDKLRDELVRSLFGKAETFRKDIIELKIHLFESFTSFCEVSALEYDKHWGGEKGNVTLTTYDGSLKITLRVNDIEAVDERINIAQELIQDCLKEWSKDANDNLQAVVNLAFKPKKNGKLSITRLRQLTTLNIADKKWQDAMKAINDSIQAIDTCEYMNFYKRDDQGKYQPMSLDFASVPI